VPTASSAKRDGEVTPNAEQPSPGTQGVGSSPRARRLAAQEGVALATVAGSGPGGRVIERDVQAAKESRPALTAAAKAAVAGGATVPATGSGLGGRATVADLTAGAEERAAGQATTPRVGAFPGPVVETPVKGIRKLIAARMLESLATTAQFTLNGAADATHLQALRARFKAAPETLGLANVTINDLLLFVVARLLPQFPFMNAHKVGDTLRTFERVHLGVAVDTPRGLMVPVLRDADRLPLEAIAAEARRLSEACRNNAVKAEELTGSTFTVTNLGALGVESFTPVLNTPEVAILGVGGLVARPILDAAGNATRFAPHIGLSLTINHQVVDGYPAAKFLKALREAITDIDLWLMR
jgi:pyruvate dehydrogenase E2 component (dihydrolipoamide acetyltransferase)